MKTNGNLFTGNLFDFSQTSSLDDDEVAASVSPKLDKETDLEVPTNGNHSEPEQVALFEKGEWWEPLWQGMPTFIQEDQEPLKTIYVHFETRADMEAFAELVKQRITLNTKSIWYPCAEIGHFAGKSYVAPELENDSIEIIEDE